MKQPVWLGVDEVAMFHRMLIEDTGGDPGIRDMRRLEAAVQKARNIYAYGAATWGKMAAVYAIGIIKGMPFNDGNKRAGLAVAATFLEINGHRLVAPEHEAVVHVLGLAAGELSESRFIDWMESRVESGLVEEAAPRRRVKVGKILARRR